jgi:glutamyl-tRNA synthetase
MGWSMPDGREVFSFADIVEHFDFDRISTTSPVFDIEKLDWLNGHYLRSLTPDQFADRLAPFLAEAGLDPSQARAQLEPVLPDLQERLRRLGEGPEAVSFFFRDELDYDPALLVGRRSTPAEVRRLLEAAIRRLAALPDWSTAAIEAALPALAEELGVTRGVLYTPIRVAVTGRTEAPPLFSTLAAIGREATLRRLRIALDRLNGQAAQ